jgi:hypothetical protein
MNIVGRKIFLLYSFGLVLVSGAQTKMTLGQKSKYYLNRKGCKIRDSYEEG